MTFERNFIRYLAAKKSVDDRALNRNVWDAMRRALPAPSVNAPLRVLEVGAGIGTMIERFIEHAVLTHATYTAIDADADHIAELNRRLPQPPGICLEPQVSDIFDFIARVRGQSKWDLLVAHAFLDLLNVPRALPQLFSLLKRGGLFYFTLNFDGATIFEPTIDPAFDAEIERLYHRTMDERVTDGMPSGDCHTGRHLLTWVREFGAEIIEAGSSDWIVFAGARGYPKDEAYFLHFIIDEVRAALVHRPELASQQNRFHDWLARRHRQIEEGTLIYIAHQIDLVGRAN
jgi:SAM-dependent methyltransferase